MVRQGEMAPCLYLFLSDIPVSAGVETLKGART